MLIQSVFQHFIVVDRLLCVFTIAFYVQLHSVVRPWRSLLN